MNVDIEKIEEMAKILTDCDFAEIKCWACFKCKQCKYDGKKHCVKFLLAEELLKHYQPKLPKDSVVLSSEEYAELKHTKILLEELEKDKTFYQNAGLNNLKKIEKLENQLKQSRKETAEQYKVAMMLSIQEMQKYLEITEEQAKLLYYHNHQVSKQFDVDVKE